MPNDALDHRRRALAARQGQEERRAAPGAPAADPGPGAQRAARPARLRHRRRRRRDHGLRRRHAATTRMDIARMAALDAGWSLDAPGVTLNRFCGSGQQAVNFAAMGVHVGPPGPRRRRRRRVDVAPGADARRRVHRQQRPPATSSTRWSPQGISADLIATVEGFSREECDRLAVDSQDRAAKAHRRGPLRPQPRADLPRRRHAGARPRGVPAAGHDARRPGQARAELRADGRATSPRARSSSLDQTALLAYPQLDEIRHVHHAGNSSGVVDGAGAVLVASPDYAKAHGLTPRARIVMTAVAGTEPVIMLTAPGPATKRCLAEGRA